MDSLMTLAVKSSTEILTLLRILRGLILEKDDVLVGMMAAFVQKSFRLRQLEMVMLVQAGLW
jgi:hypothetical protein